MAGYEDLENVTGLFLERELERHRRNLAESARIAAELAQIDGLREAAQADSGAIEARHMLGADSLWQGWLVRKRAEVLRHAALARAQEADSLTRARDAFARAEAAKSLVEKDKSDAMRRRRAAEADRIDALGVLREAGLRDS